MAFDARSAHPLFGKPLSPATLTTVGLVLIGAGLALAGPLCAALLIRSSGAGRAGTVLPLILVAVVVVVTLVGGLATSISAWRRAHRDG
ncbi:hypothetical protein [Nocardia stercoris]|uniref:Uncharacterized protein n=1 Tax=Nocardia stercoris TaxID=2483361 RepID=A0A3M2L4M7_9NOCA|nr:hypothetical protein [Nocardia stercoris]RMI32597.1 hypothetical protein EBN03_11490 [Nocardia stercoris]